MVEAENATRAGEPQTLVIGQGSIDPQTRVARGEITEQRIDELEARLRGDEFFTEIDEESTPTKCVDGRGRADGEQELDANAAGGTFSLVMADSLSGHNTYRHAGQKAFQHAKNLYGHLVKMGRKIGGHDDDHAQAPNSGCGAQDKLDNADADQPSILRYIANRSDGIRAFLSSVGVEVDDELHAKISANAGALHDEEYATNGADLRAVFTGTPGAGDDAVERLSGPHNEVVLVVNTKLGQTLDRQKVKAAFGDAYQVFNVDVWALLNGCTDTSLSPEEANERLVAALYYNVATAAVLAGRSLRVVAR